MKYRKTSTLTPAKQKFAQVYAETDNASEAVRQAYPHLNKSSQKTIQNKGSRLLSNALIIEDIQAQKQRMQAIAAKAVVRIEEIIEQGTESNSLKASVFAYEQTHGKSLARLEQRASHVYVVYDLSGGEAGEVPQEILDQLAD